MKKLTALSILLISLAFVAPAQASAATNAGVTPGSFFYFFDTTFENISLLFTFSPEQKAQKALEYADERLAEIEAIAEEKNPDGVKTAIANYESNIALATEKSKEVKDKGQAETLLNSIADNNSKNQEVLTAILIKVPDEAKEAITQAIEASKKGQEEATKQIAELKGEVEKLKNEVAELKAKDEELGKVIEELGKQKLETSQKPTPTPTPTKPITPKTPEVTLEPKPTTIPSQSKTQTNESQNTPSVTQTAPAPTPTPATTPITTVNEPVPTEISIQNQVCNLSQTNLKTEYQLYDLLQNGNTDGRIFMNAYILKNLGQNYYPSNPSAKMTITTSNHSNDKTINGSGNTGPCGYYYPYEFYATQTGTYTITYSVPEFNLSKTITLNIVGAEKPVIGSSGITISTSQKETDYPLGELANLDSTSNVKYWFQTSKPSYRYNISAWCSDADTPFSKIDVVSHLEQDSLYYYRGYFRSADKFSGITTCKFIHSTDASMTISSDSDTAVFNVK